MMKIESLYIHVPFCKKICPFCAFFKMLYSEEKYNEYLKTLEKEIILKRAFLANLKIVYIGGGTPSALGTKNIERLFLLLKKYIAFEKLTEVTIECNPESITPSFLKTITPFVTRISLGIQSFNNKKLKFLNRQDKKTNISALKLLKTFPNVSCDLITGTKFDSFYLLKKDLQCMIKYNVKHFSLYSLEIEKATRFYNLKMQDMKTPRTFLFGRNE